MKTYLLSIQAGALALWHAICGHPLHNARDAHRAVVRALYRANAEMNYNEQLKVYFDEQARAMDPHDDWHLFAKLKDEWKEHVDEARLENQKLQVIRAKMMASLKRLNELENQP